MEIIAPLFRWENPERSSVTCPRLSSLTLTEPDLEYAVSFFLSHSYYKFIVSLNLLDHFTISLTQKSLHLGLEKGKQDMSESAQMTKPCICGWGAGGARNSNITLAV